MSPAMDILNTLIYVLFITAAVYILYYVAAVGGIFKPLQNRFHAFSLTKIMPVYNTLMEKYKKELFESLDSDEVLEIGVGTGANLCFYKKGTELTVCEPNQFCRGYLEENLKLQDNVNLKKFILGHAESMSEIESESVSNVVCTLVLCSVADLDKVLKEILRILKPKGKFYFLEHVWAEKSTILYYFHMFVNPFWKLVFDGCHLTRKSWENIANAGFSDVKQRRFMANIPISVHPVLYVVRPHLIGIATK